jgi:hypothetical protein
MPRARRPPSAAAVVAAGGEQSTIIALSSGVFTAPEEDGGNWSNIRPDRS